MTFSRITLLATGLLVLNGCDQVPTASQATNAVASPVTTTVVDNSEVLATVNGKPITRNQYESYSKQRQQRRPSDPNNRNMQVILEEIINLELALQDGINRGIDKQPDIIAQIDQQRRAVIAGAAIKQQLASKPLTDDDLKKIYDEKTSGAGQEFKARHILVEDEAKAKELIKKLDGGADFSKLAKENSTGPSGKSGGDLGWFSAKQMVKPFSDAAARLKKGQYTKTPVKTQFGWHIIMLDDVRESSVPPFEQLKPQIEMFVQNQRIQQYVQDLRKQAKIDIKVKPAAAPKAPAGAELAAPDKAAEDGHAH